MRYPDCAWVSITKLAAKQYFDQPVPSLAWVPNTLFYLDFLRLFSIIRSATTMALRRAGRRPLIWW